MRGAFCEPHKPGRGAEIVRRRTRFAGVAVKISCGKIHPHAYAIALDFAVAGGIHKVMGRNRRFACVGAWSAAVGNPIGNRVVSKGGGWLGIFRYPMRYAYQRTRCLVCAFRYRLGKPDVDGLNGDIFFSVLIVRTEK